MKSFHEYNVSEETGFLINQEEIVSIPEYYKPWLELKTNLESLMNSRKLVEFVEVMPLLSVEFLQTVEARQFCRCILALATTAYVWHQRQTYIPSILPKQLAVPLRELSDYFGLIPILTHTDLVLQNTIIDMQLECSDKNCLRIKEQIISNYNWTVFQRETARIELCFAPAISAIRKLIESLDKNLVKEIIECLQILSSVVNTMRNSMKTFGEMDPDYFHLEMRPFLVGWSGESFPYPGGILYENEDSTVTRQECIGASAGQSPTLQTLDKLFKIQHSEENQHFFDTMKAYMLKGHRDFIDDLNKHVNLPEFIQKNSENTMLIGAYNDCLAAISLFRTGHMQTVTKYIINPAKKVTNSTSKSEFLQEKGTGGQDLLKFLKEIRDDVQLQKK